MDFPELLETLFSAETMPEGAMDQLLESFNFASELSNEKVLELETANGDALANLARIEEERDGLLAQLTAVQTELANVKADKFDKLMGGDSAGQGDDDIAADPDEATTLTTDELIDKYTS